MAISSQSALLGGLTARRSPPSASIPWEMSTQQGNTMVRLTSIQLLLEPRISPPREALSMRFLLRSRHREVCSGLADSGVRRQDLTVTLLSLIHISEPTRLLSI